MVVYTYWQGMHHVQQLQRFDRAECMNLYLGGLKQLPHLTSKSLYSDACKFMYVA